MKRGLLSRSAAIFAIRFFPVAAMLAVQIAFSHLLPKAQNGIYQQLWMYLSVLATLACLGIPPLLLTHSPAAVHRWLRVLRFRHLVAFFLWLCALAAVLTLLLEPEGPFSPCALLVLLVAQALALLLETYLILNDRFAFLGVQSFLHAMVFCGIHYLFLRSSISFDVMIWMLAALSLLRCGILALPAVPIFTRAAGGRRHGVLPRAIRKQWLQLGIYDASLVAFRYIDKVLISVMVGPALFSVYFYGTIEIPFIPLLLGAAGGGLLMQLASGDKSAGARLKLLNYSGAALARIVFPIFFFFFFFRNEFITVVFSERYAEAVPLFAISILVLPLRAYNFTALLQHLNQVRIVNWGALLDLGIALILAYPLFLWLGLRGVAIAFMVCSYAQALFYLIYTARLMHCSVLDLVPWKQWLLMLAIFGGAGIGMHFGLTRLFADAGVLVWGSVGTLVIIAAALAPLILGRRIEGENG